MSERHSPAVTYPLRASQLLRNGLWVVLILQAVLLALWAVEGAGHGRWQWLRMAGAVAIWSGCAVWGWQAWRAMPVGVLQWDGVRWHLEAGPTGDPAHPLKGALWVRLDLQSHLWVCLDEPGGRRTWLWLERQGAPERWGDLRRAVYSRPKPEATPADEPAAARRPPA